MTSRHHAHTSDGSASALKLSPLKLAWLAEIGLDRRLLARYQESPPPRAPQSAGLSPGVPPVSEKAGTKAASNANAATAALQQARDQLAPRSAPGTDARTAPAKTPGGIESRVRTRHPASRDMPSDVPPARPSGLPDDLRSDWTGMREHATACKSCELHMQRDQLVFGAGETDAPEWLIVGEAPGQADDRTGLPFQGKSGQLLHAMLVAIGIHPASVELGSGPQLTPAWSRPTSAYFTNLVKCRPLGNRSPQAQEIASCFPYLQEQIEALQPRRILVLGRLAAQSILQVTTELEDLRGQVHHVETRSGSRIPLVATWHPAALLMHPQNKLQAWADLNLAKNLPA